MSRVLSQIRVFSAMIVALLAAAVLSSTFSSQYDAWADTVEESITVGDFPYGIAFNSDNGYLYVTSSPGTVTVIDGATNTLLGFLIFGSGSAYGIAFDSDNGYLYVANRGSDTVIVMDGATHARVGADIPVVFPASIAFDSYNGYLYVANFFSGSVRVIDGATNTLNETIPVGNNPIGIAFDSANGKVYVVNQGDDTVTVILPSEGIPSTVPLYRLVHTSGFHFYTTDAAERDSKARPFFVSFDEHYTYEGIAAYVFSSQVPDSVPLHQLVQKSSGHFYTISTEERDSKVSDSGYQYEGIAAYVFAEPYLDQTPPVITDVPESMTEQATTSAGATVTFTVPTATDNIDGSVTVTCTPASGSEFPIGDNTVTCSATDNAGNKATETFTVSISAPPDSTTPPADTTPPATTPSPTTTPPTTTPPADTTPFTLSSSLDGNSYTVLGKTSAESSPLAFTINPEERLVHVDLSGGAGVSGNWEVTLPKKMISGIHTITASGQGAVGQQILFQEVRSTESSTTVAFTLPDNVDSIDIAGATVVPEFSTIVALVFGVTLTAVLSFGRLAKIRTNGFRI